MLDLSFIQQILLPFNVITKEEGDIIMEECTNLNIPPEVFILACGGVNKDYLMKINLFRNNCLTLTAQEMIGFFNVNLIKGELNRIKLKTSVSKIPSLPRVGEMIDKYEILSVLGKGATSVVYKAFNTILKKEVSLKVLSPQLLAQDASSADIFLEEAVNASRFMHPNSIKVLDADKRGNYTYIVMEHIEGKNLEQILKEQGKLSVKASVKVALEICKVLEAAKTIGMIHQDIKPGNIMITNKGEVKLTDFGLARVVNEPSKYQSISGKIYGTPYYMSPEAFVEPEKIDYRSDMYSLGCSLYHSLTGVLPFETTSIIKIITMHVTQNPLPPSSVNYEINKELSGVVMRLLEKNQMDRYQSYNDLYKDLEFIHNHYIAYADRNIAS